MCSVWKLRIFIISKEYMTTKKTRIGMNDKIDTFI